MNNTVYYLPGCGGLLAVRLKGLAGLDGSDEAGLAGAMLWLLPQSNPSGCVPGFSRLFAHLN